MTKQREMKKPAGKKRGRKPQYRPEFCERVVEAGRKGRTLLAFASEIGVTTQALRDWEKKHPAFAEAVAMAKEATAAWWEETARQVGREGGGNGTVTIFMLCNYAPDRYRQKQETQISADGDLLAALRGIESE